MRRPARWLSFQGLLLLEAILSVIVITAGLVFVSRALSSQLNTLRLLEERDVMASLAQAKLAELESARTSGRPTPPEAEGAFDAPHERFIWSVSAIAREVPAGELPLSEVVLRVGKELTPKAGARLSAVWPGSWVPAEWPSQ